MRNVLLSLAASAALILNAAGVQAADHAPVNISIPTAATTSTLYPIGAALGNLWSSKIPYVKASVQSSKGGVQNLQLLSTKDAQVSFAITSITYQSMKGLDKFKGHAYPDVRIIAGLYYNPNQVIARADSSVNSLKDFKGKTFVPGVAGGTTIGETAVHFAAAGLNYPGDIKAQFVGPAEAGDLMRNKQIDGVWIMAGLPNAGVSEMCTTANGRLVNIDDDTFTALQKEYPWYAKFQIPAGTYPGQNEAVQTTAVKMILMTDASMPEDVIYDLTKCFWENQDIVRQAHAVMKDISLEGAVTDLAGIPLHPGAARYYKEAGVLK
ncbi:TAXI family TRAP transporter solute-binding subunit [uncultured Mailhella sp.]|uniref:TAXI family TRAP transporter solute-binding subunit n=1 Tax=uncultured Mailhella sp. TaxID=1981031 RepID=UPI002634E9E6|nr:TAXI family TRAP transporter solute-binding subunit [uncultured Mailhella sp.]